MVGKFRATSTASADAASRISFSQCHQVRVARDGAIKRGLHGDRLATHHCVIEKRAWRRGWNLHWRRAVDSPASPCRQVDLRLTNLGVRGRFIRFVSGRLATRARWWNRHSPLLLRSSGSLFARPRRKGRCWRGDRLSWLDSSRFPFLPLIQVETAGRSRDAGYLRTLKQPPAESRPVDCLDHSVEGSSPMAVIPVVRMTR